MLFAFVLVGMAQASGQRISPQIKLLDGGVVDIGHLFQETDSCMFVTDPPRLKADWRFIFDMAYGRTGDNPERIERTEVLSVKDSEIFKVHFFKIGIEPGIYSNLIIRQGEDVLQYPDPDCEHFYNRGKIVMSVDGEDIDSAEITIDVLPSMPKVIRGEVKGTWNRVLDRYDGATLDLYVHMERTDYIYLSTTRTPFLLSPPQFSWCESGPNRAWDIDCIEYDFYQYRYRVAPDTYRITLNSNWGRYYRLRSLNYFGTVGLSDIICFDDYITDPEVLARIEELRQQAGVENVSADGGKGKLIVDGDLIVFTGDSSSVTSMVVTDLSGRIVATACGTDGINISHLTTGMYIAACKLNNNSTKTIKFHKP